MANADDARSEKYKNGTYLADWFFFAATDGNYGKELFKNDGTEAGTVLVKN